MTSKLQAFAKLIPKMSQSDLVALLRAAELEAYRRGLRGALREDWHMYQRAKRVERILTNGENTELRTWRKSKNMTLKQAASIFHISVATLNNYEMGATKTPARIMDYIRQEELNGTL